MGQPDDTYAKTCKKQRLTEGFGIRRQSGHQIAAPDHVQNNAYADKQTSADNRDASQNRDRDPEKGNQPSKPRLTRLSFTWPDVSRRFLVEFAAIQVKGSCIGRLCFGVRQARPMIDLTV